jgi:hypothetical protein
VMTGGRSGYSSGKAIWKRRMALAYGPERFTEGQQSELAGMRHRMARAIPLRTNNTPVHSRGSSGTGATYRPLGLACFKLALRWRACQ